MPVHRKFTTFLEKRVYSTCNIHTPLLFRKSIKSCLVRNFTAGDCPRLATLDIDAEEVDNAEEPDEVEGEEDKGGVEGVGAAAEEGLDEAAPVSGVPVALDSPAV